MLSSESVPFGYPSDSGKRCCDHFPTPDKERVQRPRKLRGWMSSHPDFDCPFLHILCWPGTWPGSSWAAKQAASTLLLGACRFYGARALITTVISWLSASRVSAPCPVNCSPYISMSPNVLGLGRGHSSAVCLQALTALPG